jgi:protein KRI1
LDILAADDADLNSYAGLKKYATFRDKEKKKRDKKRYAKKKLLKQWRREVFGDPNGVQMPADWKPEGFVKKEAKAEAEAGKVDIKESGGGDRKKKRKKRKSKA